MYGFNGNNLLYDMYYVSACDSYKSTKSFSSVKIRIKAYLYIVQRILGRYESQFKQIKDLCMILSILQFLFA